MTDPLSPVVLKTTAEKQEELQRIASLLVEKNLAACVQISGPVVSVYRWEGKVEASNEFVAEIKTDRSLISQVVQLIETHHSYDVPQILLQPLEIANESYASWMKEQLGI